VAPYEFKHIVDNAAGTALLPSRSHQTKEDGKFVSAQ
jgi:hypothetical protein